MTEKYHLLSNLLKSMDLMLHYGASLSVFYENKMTKN